jgi:Glycosyl hydrolase family 81 C-terminal domain
VTHRLSSFSRYHIYAAAAVAHFDPNWGKQHFDQVLLLVRDIANPSSEDPSFPRFRHKDWYFGASWASGVPQPPYLNGKNQESSSEAIASAESLALFGQEMSKIWRSAKQEKKAAIANEIATIGKVMAGTELTSAKRYWHVDKKDDPRRIYPEVYEHNVVGILWSTMAQFGTWFGAAEYLPYGIQLLPLTPISEDRDDLDWSNTIYKPLTTSCAADFKCTTSGWSVYQLAILATIGYAGEAAMRVKELPNDSFENAGGNGNSRTNTIWYIGTRPEVNDPIKMLRYDVRGNEEKQPAPVYELTDCYLPNDCTDEVLDRQAGEFSNFTCRSRITWLIETMEQAEWDACWRVGGLEFPDVCGPCNPGVHFVSKEQKIEVKTREKEEKTSAEIESGPLQCPACTLDECNSDLNRCPVYKRTFVCTKGTSKGGCSGEPRFWAEEEQCGKRRAHIALQ